MSPVEVTLAMVAAGYPEDWGQPNPWSMYVCLVMHLIRITCGVKLSHFQGRWHGLDGNGMNTEYIYIYIIIYIYSMPYSVYIYKINYTVYIYISTVFKCIRYILLPSNHSSYIQSLAMQESLRRMRSHQQCLGCIIQCRVIHVQHM